MDEIRAVEFSSARGPPAVSLGTFAAPKAVSAADLL
jgi:hypothetical protein